MAPQDPDGRLIIGGERISGGTTEPVADPYEVRSPLEVHQAGRGDVDRAIATVVRGQRDLVDLPLYKRTAILRDAARLMEEQREILAGTISRQTGKSLKDTRAETVRSIGTMLATASAAESFAAATAPADSVPAGHGVTAMVIREPLGTIAAITPFNAPLNLLVHKVAPALAVGNGVIVKPPPQAPITALQFVEILLEAGLPRESIAVVPGGADTGSHLVSHSDIDAVSFTGSAAVGEQIASLAGMKHLVLELGGNSPNIVHQDANLARAVPLLASAGFSNAGQSCNSVQRVLVHHSVHDELLEGLVEAARRMVVGDPLDDATDIGTLVDEAAAIRVEGMIQAARDEGAQIITGGERSGSQMTPTILTAVEPEMEISSEEVFGPVVVLMPYSDIDEAISKANATTYGLQAAVFTESLGVAHKAIRELRFGGVMVNRPSKFRLDHLPFGGVKRSGIGRESALYSLLEFTATKLAVIDASG